MKADSMHPDLAEVLVPAERIAARVAEMGAEITRDYAGRELVLICILKGSFMFTADLCRHIGVPVNYGFMAIGSYGDSTKTSGVVRIIKDLDSSIQGRHCLVVEDIVDTGLTVSYLLSILQGRAPASLKICSLLNKPSCRIKDVPVDYCGFIIPDKFVVGYGLDYKDFYRNLPCVGVLKPEIYMNEEHR